MEIIEMYYSASTNGFYPEELKSTYVSAGNWPDDAIKVSENEWKTYGESDAPEGHSRGPDENGRPSWVPNPKPSIDELAKIKSNEIDRHRDMAFSSGMVYENDIIQTRPQDQINLIGLSSRAKQLIDAGSPESEMTFRTGSNKNWTLTAGEVMDLSIAALTHIEDIYSTSWSLKDGIEDARKNGDYDVLETISWPANG